MLYMVIETFEAGADVVYDRFGEKGRMLPDGLNYIDSWVTQGMDKCFQVMETDDPALSDEWMTHWNDIVSFEVVPVLPRVSAQNQI